MRVLRVFWPQNETETGEIIGWENEDNVVVVGVLWQMVK